MQKILILLLLLCPLSLRPQEVEFTADRPGMGTGTDILGKGKVSWEYGMAYDYEKEDGAATRSFTFCNSLFRFGLSQNIELRLELDATHQWSRDYKTTGVEPVMLGTKVKLYDGEDAIPSVALLANVALPWASEAFRPSHVAPSVYVLADHDVSDKLNLCYNVGLEWDGETSAPTTFTALCLGYSFSEKCGMYVENFNYFHKHASPVWNCDLGAWMMLSPRVQLDAAAAFNLNHTDSYANISFGVAWLMN